MYTIMVNEQKKRSERLRVIRKGINPSGDRGDITYLARKLETSRTWVSLVINGHGVSERVLRAAEELINARQN